MNDKNAEAAAQAATRLKVQWSEGLHFGVVTEKGAELSLDGDSQTTASPMEALLASLCGCMAIDVVMILQKMRADLQGLQVTASGERSDEPPRYFRKIELQFEVQGDIPFDKVDRAIQLSFAKYCSVFHTLRKDIDVDYKLTLG